MVSNYQKTLRKLWNGLCDIYIREVSINPVNGRNEAIEILKFQNQPCRLSFSSISSASESNSTALVQQTTKLFISKDIKIPPGSKIVITQEGETEVYQMSGKPAVYSCHQEVMLELFEEWA